MVYHEISARYILMMMMYIVRAIVISTVLVLKKALYPGKIHIQLARQPDSHLGRQPE